MEKIRKILMICCIILFITGCKDDYLDQSQTRRTISDSTGIYLTPTTGYSEYAITVPGAGNSYFSIGRYPKWFEFRYLKGSFKNDTVRLKFTVRNVPATYEPGSYESELSITIDDLGVYIVPVYFVNN